MDRSVLQKWVLDALKALGGAGTPIEVSKVVWEAHEVELRGMGDLFFTWQYDLRWAATRLRHQGKLEQVSPASRGRWWLPGYRDGRKPT